MHFDDRLETVLRLPDSGDGLARIQYRQLIDIIGRLPAHVSSDALDAGFAQLDTLAKRIPAAERARFLRQPLQPITNPRLLHTLAQDEPEVASAAVCSARLDDAHWLQLIPALPVRARGFLRHRRDLSAPVEALLERLGVHDRGLPPASIAAPEAPAIAPGADDADDEYISDDVLELLDLADDPPEPTSLSEWARAKAARDRQPAPAPAPVSRASDEAGIGAIVRRIEEFRKAREARSVPQAANEDPRLPLGDAAPAAERQARSIDFTTDPEGRIRWADGPHAPAVFGLSIAANDDDPADIPGPGSAVRRRLPLEGARLQVNGAPAVSGEWQVDAVPRFDPAGQFTGYCGRMRRPVVLASVEAAAATRREADRMREILHELRTPANAIQVAAEIIQQQLYGPAPHEYRALAAAIASDCAHILAGFEELDRLVKLETGAQQIESGTCDLVQVLTRTVDQLRSWTEPRHSGFTIDPAQVAATLPVGIDPTEADRLIWRLFAALAGATAPDEALPLAWKREGDGLTVDVTLPAALAEREDGQLFGTPPGGRGQSLSAGMFGIGFSLRLAAAEAAAAGGSLQRQDNSLHLSLPCLTPEDAGNSSSDSHSH